MGKCIVGIDIQTEIWSKKQHKTELLTGTSSMAKLLCQKHYSYSNVLKKQIASAQLTSTSVQSMFCQCRSKKLAQPGRKQHRRVCAFFHLWENLVPLATVTQKYFNAKRAYQKVPRNDQNLGDKSISSYPWFSSPDFSLSLCRSALFLEMISQRKFLIGKC